MINNQTTLIKAEALDLLTFHAFGYPINEEQKFSKTKLTDVEQIIFEYVIEKFNCSSVDEEKYITKVQNLKDAKLSRFSSNLGILTADVIEPQAKFTAEENILLKYIWSKFLEVRFNNNWIDSRVILTMSATPQDLKGDA
jgi:hypothetical protein